VIAAALVQPANFLAGVVQSASRNAFAGIVMIRKKSVKPRSSTFLGSWHDSSYMNGMLETKQVETARSWWSWTFPIGALALVMWIGAAGLIRADDGSSSGAKQSGNAAVPQLAGSEKSRVVSRDELKVMLSVKDYLGVDLVDRHGSQLGRIVDFTLKEKDGPLDTAVVSASGVLGFNEVLVLVPFSDIEQKPGTRNLVLKVDKADFDAFLNVTRSSGQRVSSKATEPGGAKTSGRRAAVAPSASGNTRSETASTASSDASARSK